MACKVLNFKTVKWLNFGEVGEEKFGGSRAEFEGENGDENRRKMRAVEAVEDGGGGSCRSLHGDGIGA